MKITYTLSLDIETDENAPIEAKVSGIATALQEGMEANLGENEAMQIKMFNAEIKQEFNCLVEPQPNEY